LTAQTHETPFSTQQDRPQAPARLPFAHVNGGRPQGHRAAQGFRPQEAVGLKAAGPGGPAMETLKSRAHFLRAQRGVRRSSGALTLEVCASPEAGEGVRVGFTASKKVGNAVARNRAKRRLRAAANALLPLYGLPGNDYVLVARTATIDRPFEALLADLKDALHAANARLGRTKTGDP
jgi:ribonuclease P protein component